MVFENNKICRKINRWLEHVEWKNKTHQKNFIGKSMGYEIDFKLKDGENKITVFTTKPETLLDVKFIVTFSDNGVEQFTNNYAICPLTKNEIPIYTSNYVIKGYGSGYVMGVPNDDKRDRDFAIRLGIPFNLDKSIVSDNNVVEYYSRMKINYKLHDMAFSRQRKWGEPIPIDGESDTMPSYAGSNWYFFRYLDSKNENFFCDLDKQKDWLPVDLYVIGSEHTTGHILYARFITKFLYDLGYSTVDEPFKKILNVGLMNASDGTKMSKSKGNVINPDDVILKYGIDAYRLWICFIAPFEQSKIWKEDGLKGCVKFIIAFENLFKNKSDTNVSITEEQSKMLFDLKNRIDKDISNFSFNTAIPRFMTIVNNLNKFEKINKDLLLEIVKILKPFCPNFNQKILETYK